MPNGEGTLGLVSVSLRGLMFGLWVVGAALTGFWTGVSLAFVAVFAAIALSGFFGREAGLAGSCASVLTLEIALSFLTEAPVASLSEVDSFDFALISLTMPAASLAEDSRLSAAAGRGLAMGFGGSFLGRSSFMRLGSSLTSPSSSSSELCTTSSDLIFWATFLDGIDLFTVTFLGLLSRSLAAAAASLASFSCFFFSKAPFFWTSFNRFSIEKPPEDLPVVPLVPRGVPVLPVFGVPAALA